ncbi:MAG: prepilin-type N-terminal cleavage/methylation domain-containing protein [Candidatus Omnitrophica bacterium]|nr:prepilin-type N-terminal cleavage/methylation domain-containing protein [Candidatus Omnitrophota bacterium]
MSHKNSGLTLVETMVALTILSILSLSVYTIFKSGIDAWSKSEERLEVYQDARVVLDQISRELVGAFADGADAKLEGLDGGAAADTLTFVTNFSDSLYKIRYELITDAVYTSKKALQRGYIDYSVDTGVDYTSAVSHLVTFVPATKEIAVSNIKFQYLPVMTAPTGLADWAGAVTTWTDTALPEAVKIILTFQDATGRDRTFETIVYLPNSETE